MAQSPTATERIITILKASRWPGWSFGPILFVIGAIHSQKLPKDLATLIPAVLQIGALSFPLCTIVFGVNDVYDYESDLRNPRKVAAGLEGSVLNPVFHSDVLASAWTSTVLIPSISLLSRHPQNILTNIALVFLGWQYSAPPLRLKEVPVIDSFSNGLIVFLGWFAGFSFSGRTIFDAPAKGYMLSLCTTGIHAIAAAADVEADIAAGQRTIAIALGKRLTAIFAALCYLVASTTVELKSLFGIYVWCGLAIMLVPCILPELAHRTFQAITYYSIASSVVWLGFQAQKVLSRR